MPTSTSRSALMHDLALALFKDARFSYVGATTADGTATTLVDSGLAYGDADTNMLGQRLVRIDETVTKAFSPAVTINEGAPFSATDTSLTVNDDTGVTVNDILVIESERLLCTAKPGANVLTVTRGIDSTTAAIHADGTAVTRSGPIAGSVTRVRSAGLTIASGVVTIQQINGIVLSGTDYSFWDLIHPEDAERWLNHVLSGKKREVVSPLTLVTDGDMETTGVTNWTTVGTVSTKEKVTTAAYVRHGAQSLHILNGAAASGVRTASYPALRSRVWLVAATIKVITGTISLAGYDATNSADIGTPPSTGEVAWQTLFYTFSVPSTCVNVQVRITAGDAAEFYVDSVHLWPANQVEYELPSWVEDPYRDLLDVGYFRLWTSPVDSDLYNPEESEWVSTGYSLSPIIDEAGAHPFRIILERPVSSFPVSTGYPFSNHSPLCIKALRPFAELSTDSDTTTADAKGLVRTAMWHIYDQLAAANVANKELYQIWIDRRNSVGLRAFGRLAGTRELRPRMKVRATYGSY